MIEGTLVTGLGRGQKFISFPVYSEIFANYLGNPPFFGTLNLRVHPDNCNKIDRRFELGRTYENLLHNGERVGAIIVTKITLRKKDEILECMAVRPLKTSHSSGIIEIVSDKHIRDFWDLTDGDKVLIDL